ncbi:class I SAM-dependent methyltransferase [Actinoplanes sp. NPDC051851]|uniref:class I SAM-dependent methyltransferase n=1 Tax=Actinoplanes sp. NPDC051851 TaxID=3154753 RepID=UPI00342CC677
MIDWDDAYRTDTAPWDIGRPQPAIMAVLENAVRGPRILDVGCGTGDLVIALARRGFHVTGVDISPVAIAAAKKKAADVHVRHVRLQVRDITEPDTDSHSHTVYNTVFDCGLLHNLHRQGGPVGAYLDVLPTLVAPDGFLYVLAVSAEAGEGWTVTRDYLEATFTAPHWVSTIVKDVQVIAEDGYDKITMPGFLLRTTRE